MYIFSVDALGQGLVQYFYLVDWYIHTKVLSRKVLFTAIKSSYICSKRWTQGWNFLLPSLIFALGSFLSVAIAGNKHHMRKGLEKKVQHLKLQ